MSILFATPCYGAMVTTAFLGSCLKLKEALIVGGVDHDFTFIWHESLVHRGRMEITASYLKTDYRCLCFIDADIDFEPDAIAKLWNICCEKPCVAVGVYSMKSLEFPTSAWLNGKLIKLEECPKEPFEVDYAGTGMMMIRREVIEAVDAASESWEGKNSQRVPGIFMTPIHEGMLESEDYHFCRRARECGFKVVADPSIKLGHWGQFRYGG